MAEKNALFSGLRKLIFKDEPDAAVPLPPVPPPAEIATPRPEVAATSPIPARDWPPAAGDGDEATRAKAYQLLESINQPGVDFLEVWNAASENGGPGGLKAAFSALRFADKSLTREKVITTGRYYTDALQKALNADLEKKAAQQRQLQEEKARQRQTLSADLDALEKQIVALQNALAEKRRALTDLDSGYEPRLRELEQKMASGKATIEALLQQMHAVLQAAEREL